MKLGLVINPIAGIGGSAALKGSDGLDILEEALKRGSTPKANNRAKIVFEKLLEYKNDLEIYTAPGKMGEDMLHELGYEYKVVGSIGEKTTSEDTKRIAHEIKNIGVDLLIFTGGDGTARDIYDAVGVEQLCIGIPSGTKMHSAVFAITPETAFQLIEKIINNKNKDSRLQEVMDIDEEAFRQERLSAKLYGYLLVPVDDKLVQTLKDSRSMYEKNDIQTICQYGVDIMEDDTLYLVGTGSTIRPIMDILGLDGSLLGVDAVYNKKLIKKDVTEKEILDLLAKYPKRKIYLTVIGRQGYILGRGNQQFSYRVINEVGKENILVFATPGKMKDIKGPLLVDTGNEDTDNYLKGYMKIITDYDFFTLKKVQ